MLHDIGKLGVPSAILDKPGKLTDQEFALLKHHPADTHRILSRSAAFADVVELAARHHEKLDGSGYHRGLPGDQLTQSERVLCVADIYEALAAKRPYRKDLTDGEVFDILGSMAAKGAVYPASVDACRAFVHKTGFECYQVAA
jgi:HD-GYP domain-containing protein (c-di-GMP phosphodiesterase class II)